MSADEIDHGDGALAVWEPPRAHVADRAHPNRLRRLVARALGTGVIAMVLLGAAIWVKPEVGQVVAEGVRSVLGPAPVAFAEDTYYGLVDWARRTVAPRAEPQAYWDTPPRAAAAPSGASDARAEGFPPWDFAPPHPDVAAPGDGTWIAVPDDVARDRPAAMWKTLVHPDPTRPYAAVAVLALDLREARLHAVVGTEEPESPRAAPEVRTGLVETSHRGSLIAAWSGGFRAINGRFGMMVDGHVVLPARRDLCTITIGKDGALHIGTWSRLGVSADALAAYRQTPPCMLEGGARGRNVHREDSHIWGVSVDGETVIRRSALGLDAERRTLFYAIGDSLSTEAITVALERAGATDAAMLDVNASVARCVFFEHDESGRPSRAAMLVPGTYHEGMYVTRRWSRDFFYVTRDAR